MDTAIISSLISAGAAILVCILNFRAQTSKLTALLEYKLDELQKQVEKHNSLIERTYKLEQDVSVLAEKQSIANHRLDKLEQKE